jgi:hypothetical protein
VRGERIARGWSVIHLAAHAHAARQVSPAFPGSPTQTPQQTSVDGIDDTFGIAFSTDSLPDLRGRTDQVETN